MPKVITRYTDTRSVKCEDCGWTGMVKDCGHDYECPECESENLIIEE